jgi:hypothetical protein
MGYIGLLLNAPYKIDSMVWMRMMMMLLCFVYEIDFVYLGGLCEPRVN